MPGRTPSQTVGPFFSLGLCSRPAADLARADERGAVRVEGRVVDGAGAPVPDAMVEIWQADERGEYRGDWGWARCGTDASGRYAFRTLKPGSVAGQAPHLVILVFARGLLKPVLTRMYFPEDDANAADPVLAAVDESERATLIASGDGAPHVFDVCLQGDRQTVFFVI